MGVNGFSLECVSHARTRTETASDAWLPTKLREKNYTRKLVAHWLGKTPSAITRKMNGANGWRLRIDEVHKISQFLQLTAFLKLSTA